MATHFYSEKDILEQVLCVLKSSPDVMARYKAIISMFEDRKFRALNNKFRMGVLGVTSSGKSTLINTFLIEDLLPTAVIPSSSQLVSCLHGNTRSATIYFEDKEEKFINRSNLNTNVIRKYGEEKSNPNNIEKVKQIEITSPCFPFSDDLVLVDSPGLDAYGFEGHEQLTLNTLLPSVDFCLFITTCKTNSDSKMKSILNTINHYEKPVIIIQNMIDSIKPSLNIDGTIRKTVEELADEHVRRLNKVVAESLIKTNVPIIQFSAVWARKAQTEKDQKLLVKSGYPLLVHSISKLFNRLKPKAEANRLDFLRKDLENIKKEAEQDGKESLLPIGKFEYEDLVPHLISYKNEINKTFQQLLQSLSVEVEKVRQKWTISESDITQSKKLYSYCTDLIASSQRKYYQEIKKAGNQLHIETTQLFNEQSSFKNMKDPSIKYEFITHDEWRDKDGFGNKLKRGVGSLFNKEDWGREKISIREKIINVDASKDSIIGYYRRAYSEYDRIITEWNQMVNFAIQKISNEVEKHLDEYKARKEKALNAKVYLNIANKIQAIIDQIPKQLDIHIKENEYSKADETSLLSKSISKLAYDVSRLAGIVRGKIHQKTFECIYSKNDISENVIMGWDFSCLQDFILQCVGTKISETKESEFRIKNFRFRVCCDNNNCESLGTYSNKPRNVFIMVSALQHGHALNQISKIKLGKYIQRYDHLFFVIQDFEEILNAKVIEDALGSFRNVHTTLNLPVKPTILLFHDNPIYNLAAVETQIKLNQGYRLVQNDELLMLHQLQKSSFGFLCKNVNTSNYIVQIIKSLKWK